MEQAVRRDNRGMTLIEVLISLMLLAIVSLALIQSALLAINTNVRNELRDEAVSVAEQRLNELRNTPFTGADLADTTSTGPVTETDITRKIRSVSCNYTPKREVKLINSNTKQITLTVAWTYKGVSYNHSTSTVVRSQ